MTLDMSSRTLINLPTLIVIFLIYLTFEIEKFYDQKYTNQYFCCDQPAFATRQIMPEHS